MINNTSVRPDQEQKQREQEKHHLIQEGTQNPDRHTLLVSKQEETPKSSRKHRLPLNTHHRPSHSHLAIANREQ